MFLRKKNRVAKFEKVSLFQFREEWENTFKSASCDQDLYYIHIDLELPTRATKDSAGYDFYAPFKFTLNPGQTIKIPTGIRCKMKEGWVLKCYPRSGLGFKYRLRLDNSVGIVDGDYVYSDNEGHIFAKITNEGNKTLTVNAGEAFMQGIFVPYGITVDDKVTAVRNGGFGSTDKIGVR